MRNVLFVILLLFPAVAEGQEIQQFTFNELLVVQLSGMLNISPPEIIEIEVLSNREMRDYRLKQYYDNCVRGIPPGVGRIRCVIHDEDVSLTLYGKWIPEKNPQHFHILLNKESGTVVLIHEFLHWWLANQTTPPGLLNYDDATVENFAQALMSSYTMAEWLEEQNGEAR